MGRNGRCCPIRIAIIGHYASQMLELVVFILYAAFQPVVAVEVEYDTTLVKPMVTFGEVRFYDKTEILLLCLHLEYRGVVVSEMIIGALPKIGAWFCDYLYGVAFDGEHLRLSRPFKIVDV